MTRFQIRTPQNKVFEDILLDMSAEALDQMKDLLDPSFVQSASTIPMMHQLRLSVEPYVKKYDLCNLFPECSDEVEGAPYLDYKDRIYLLDVPQGLSTFYDDLAFEVGENFKHLWKTGVRREIFARLRKSFKKIFSHYLYLNPICRDSRICEESKQIPTWSQETSRLLA